LPTAVAFTVSASEIARNLRSRSASLVELERVATLDARPRCGCLWRGPNRP
jgi:hypothetical protein